MTRSNRTAIQRTRKDESDKFPLFSSLRLLERASQGPDWRSAERERLASFSEHEHSNEPTLAISLTGSPCSLRPNGKSPGPHAGSAGGALWPLQVFTATAAFGN
jgi:hypothetical protein